MKPNASSFSGEPSSHCFGAIRDGVFDGQIVTREGVYYVERAARFPNLDLIRKSAFSASPASQNRSRSGEGEREVHSVIYHEKHVKDPWQHGTKKFGEFSSSKSFLIVRVLFPLARL